MHIDDPPMQLALIATKRVRSRPSRVRQLSRMVPEAWVAKCAVAAAENGLGREAAMMLAVLTQRDVELLAKVFHRSVRDAGTLRHYVAYLRSNKRRSLGTRPKKMIQDWLNARPAWRLRVEAFGEFRPTLADIVRLTHPKPVDGEHSIVFAWMAGRPVAADDLPEVPLEPPRGVPDVTEPVRQSETRVKAPSRRRMRSISMVEGVEL